MKVAETKVGRVGLINIAREIMKLIVELEDSSTTNSEASEALTNLADEAESWLDCDKEING